MKTIQTDIVVVGAGPGGYAAAFYAADKGKKAILIDRDTRLGGVCLNYGCIPSKAYLHAAHLINEAMESHVRGIFFEKPRLDPEKIRAWKDSIVGKLSGGINMLAKARGVDVINGRGHFEDSETLRVETEEGQQYIKYGSAIIAVGSRPAMPKAFDLGNPRVMTSTEALELEEIPEKLLVVGGGYIGMEIGIIYSALGSNVVLVEALESVLVGADKDLLQPVIRKAKQMFQEIRLSTKVLKMATSGKQIQVTMQVDGEEVDELYDRVLVSIGRVPNGADLGLENTKVERDDAGFIQVNEGQRTSDPCLYAIGDVVGGALLAHKATREGRIAVDAILGESVPSREIVIPAVVFTDPELAWCGLTETEAREKGIPVKIAKFPWAASGRALSFDRPDGLTKLVVDPESERILGVGIVGVGAGELIGEGAFAIEMGATAKDLAETIHPHPTLSETLMEAAEAFYGLATHTATGKRPRQ